MENQQNSDGQSNVAGQFHFVFGPASVVHIYQPQSSENREPADLQAQLPQQVQGGVQQQLVQNQLAVPQRALASIPTMQHLPTMPQIQKMHQKIKQTNSMASLPHYQQHEQMNHEMVQVQAGYHSNMPQQQNAQFISYAQNDNEAGQAQQPAGRRQRRVMHQHSNSVSIPYDQSLAQQRPLEYNHHQGVKPQASNKHRRKLSQPVAMNQHQFNAGQAINQQLILADANQMNLQSQLQVQRQENQNHSPSPLVHQRRYISHSNSNSNLLQQNQLGQMVKENIQGIESPLEPPLMLQNQNKQPSQDEQQANNFQKVQPSFKAKIPKAAVEMQRPNTNGSKRKNGQRPQKRQTGNSVVMKLNKGPTSSQNHQQQLNDAQLAEQLLQQFLSVQNSKPPKHKQMQKAVSVPRLQQATSKQNQPKTGMPNTTRSSGSHSSRTNALSGITPRNTVPTDADLASKSNNAADRPSKGNQAQNKLANRLKSEIGEGGDKKMANQQIFDEIQSSLQHGSQNGNAAITERKRRPSIGQVQIDTHQQIQSKDVNVRPKSSYKLNRDGQQLLRYREVLNQHKQVLSAAQSVRGDKTAKTSKRSSRRGEETEVDATSDTYFLFKG